MFYLSVLIFAGARLAAQLQGPGLQAVLVFGQGVAINGSALVEGLSSGLPPQAIITGGLAGDGGAIRKRTKHSPLSTTARIASACRPDPQKRLTVVPATLTGKPARTTI